MAKTQAELLKEALGSMSAAELQEYLTQKREDEKFAKAKQSNLDITTEGDDIVIRFNSKTKIGVTEGGNTKVASSAGAVRVGDIFISITAYKKDAPKGSAKKGDK